MAWSEEFIANLDAAQAAVEDWLAAKQDEIDRRVTFLRSIDVTLSQMSEVPATDAGDETEDFINEILSS